MWKLLNFKVIFGLKKLEIYFYIYIYFRCGNGSWYTSPYLKVGCLFCLFWFVCLLSWDLPNRASLGHIFGTVKKCSTRKGAWALFHVIWTFGMIVIDFWVIFGSKKLKNYFYFCFGCGNSTRYISFDETRHAHWCLSFVKLKCLMLFVILLDFFSQTLEYSSYYLLKLQNHAFIPIFTYLESYIFKTIYFQFVASSIEISNFKINFDELAEFQNFGNCQPINNAKTIFWSMNEWECLCVG